MPAAAQAQPVRTDLRARRHRHRIRRTVRHAAALRQRPRHSGADRDRAAAANARWPDTRAPAPTATVSVASSATCRPAIRPSGRSAITAPSMLMLPPIAETTIVPVLAPTLLACSCPCR